MFVLNLVEKAQCKQVVKKKTLNHNIYLLLSDAEKWDLGLFQQGQHVFQFFY